MRVMTLVLFNILKPTPPGLPLSGEELGFPPDLLPPDKWGMGGLGGLRGVGLRKDTCVA